MCNGHQLVRSVSPERQRERQSLVDVVFKFLVELGSAAALDVLLESVAGFEPLPVAGAGTTFVQ